MANNIEAVEIKDDYIPKPSVTEMSGVGQIQQDGVPQGAENTRTEVKEPEKPSLKEILSHPFDYCSIICFLIGAVLGLIFLIMAAAGAGQAMIVSAILAFLGCYAAYEIRMLAALKKELNALKEVQKKLGEEVDKLESQVDQYDQQNEEFKKETAELDSANDRFRQEVAELEQISNELTGTKEEFEKHNDDLKEEMTRLEQSKESMQKNLETLTKQTDELENQYKQFEGLQNQIQRYAEQNGIQMGEALAKQQEMFGKLEGVMRDNASTLLQQIAMDMEFLDNDDGMSREEYDQWRARIPQRFRDMLDEKGITFDNFAGEDGVMQYDEMAGLIETLLNQNQ